MADDGNDFVDNPIDANARSVNEPAKRADARADSERFQLAQEQRASDEKVAFQAGDDSPMMRKGITTVGKDGRCPTRTARRRERDIGRDHRRRRRRRRRRRSTGRRAERAIRVEVSAQRQEIGALRAELTRRRALLAWSPRSSASTPRRPPSPGCRRAGARDRRRRTPRTTPPMAAGAGSSDGCGERRRAWGRPHHVFDDYGA